MFSEVTNEGFLTYLINRPINLVLFITAIVLLIISILDLKLDDKYHKIHIGLRLAIYICDFIVVLNIVNLFTK